MTRTLLPPADAGRGATSSAGRHRALDDRATADFLAGDYVPAARAPAPAEPARPDRPYVPQPASAAPVSAGSGYRPLPRLGYAVVLYATAAGRVGTVIAPFADALSAEQYALDSGFASYDVVPATPVAQAVS
jgi:hypothetical protein